MDQIHLRLECLRIASANLQAGIAAGRELVPVGELAERVTRDAGVLVAFVKDDAAKAA